jgi:hypothetical protein
VKIANNFGRKDLARLGRNVIGPLVPAMVLVSCSFADEPADPFDTPIRKVSVDAGRWPENADSGIRQTLTCYYYPQVMVKEYDVGGSGAVGLSMLRREGDAPSCEPSRQSGERVIDLSEWEGYLKGVKDTLVFFDPPDDFHGHSAFAIFDSVSGEKIFEDTAYGESVPSVSYLTSRPQVIATDGEYSLKYMRVADADSTCMRKGAPAGKGSGLRSA